ncbi:hypothetical protein AAVH_38436 [Aphelenchoides avenae]|nr:hypothetical protein AAVH_38436 [Aphelenchus avenae]
MLSHHVVRPEDTSAFCFDFVNRPRMMYAFLGVGAIFLVFEAVSVFTGYLVINRLRRTAKFSVRTSQMHLQLTRLLIAQILSPVLCMFLPVAAACVAILANGGILVYALDGYIALTMLSLFPLINAMLTILFVAPYRQFTVKWLTFGKVILNKMESTVAENASGIHIVSDVVAAYQRRQTMVFVYVQRSFRPLGS